SSFKRTIPVLANSEYESTLGKKICAWLKPVAGRPKVISSIPKRIFHDSPVNVLLIREPTSPSLALRGGDYKDVTSGGIRRITVSGGMSGVFPCFISWQFIEILAPWAECGACQMLLFTG